MIIETGAAGMGACDFIGGNIAMAQYDLRGRRGMPRIPMTGMTLKLYGCITMLFYSFSMSVIQNGLLHINQYSSAQLLEMMTRNEELLMLSSWAMVFQLLGGLAVPVFAFLLVEGFSYTENYRNYLLRMLLFALVSEIPYDFAMTGRWWDPSSQNLLFTLTLCLVMLYGLRLYEKRLGMQVLIVTAAVFWSALLRTSFGLCTVLLTAIYYLLEEKPRTKWILSSIVSLLYVSAPLSTFALVRYNGERGINWNKYIFYVLYPAHLLIFGIIAHLVAG